MESTVLDTRGLACPLPVLKAKKVLAGLKPGATLEVIATDPQSPADFEVLCSVGGHILMASSHADGVYRFQIRRG